MGDERKLKSIFKTFFEKSSRKDEQSPQSSGVNAVCVRIANFQKTWE